MFWFWYILCCLIFLGGGGGGGFFFGIGGVRDAKPAEAAAGVLMLRRWFPGLKGAAPAKRLVPPRRRAQVGPAMLEAVEEVAVYIHRFHNLDLFQQGYLNFCIVFFCFLFGV